MLQRHTWKDLERDERRWILHALEVSLYIRFYIKIRQETTFYLMKLDYDNYLQITIKKSERAYW